MLSARQVTIPAISLCCLTGALTFGQTPPAQADLPIYSAAAELVVLNVSVTEPNGAAVTGLSQEIFSVYEDGQPQTIAFFANEVRPVTVGLVMDRSMSMARKRDAVVSAALAFARSSNPEDELFTISFNERVRFGLPADVPFTNDFGLLRPALEGVNAAGRTALYDALLTSLAHLERGSFREKALILISDGGDNASKAKRAEVVRHAEETGAVIYSVAIVDDYTTDADPDMLRQLARLTGGRAFFARDAGQADEILQEIAREIRSSYTIGYVPTNDIRDGTFRHVTVLVRAPGRDRFHVRTRTGYVAPGAPPVLKEGGP